MILSEISRTEWLNMNNLQHMEVCNKLVKQSYFELDLVFEKIKQHDYCGIKFPVAIFHQRSYRTEFVFIPAAENEMIGFDKNNFTPTNEQLISYSESQKGWEYNISEYSLNEYINKNTLACRTTNTPAMLVESFCFESSASHSINKVSDLDSILEETGCRLLTANEWEYICGSGTNTLFRWGNECPADHYPENNYFKLHSIPNLFGLWIASSTKKPELVSDGPMALSGGFDSSVSQDYDAPLLAWLSLATSWREPMIKEFFNPHNLSEPFFREYGVRRVYKLY